MAQQSNDIVPMPDAEIPNKRNFDPRAVFSRIFRQEKKYGAMPGRPDKPPRLFIKDESQDRVAGDRLGEVGHVVAKTKDSTQYTVGGNIVSATNSNAGAEGQDIVHQDNASHAETVAGRNLWAKAFESNALTFNEKLELLSPWKSLDSQNGSLHGFRARDNTGLKDNPAEVGRKGTNKLNSFDESGIASAAWKVVSFGLTLVGNDKRRMDEAFTSSAYLAGLLTRYRKIEAVLSLQEPEESEREPLEAAIVEVYKAVLKYSLAVKKAAEGSTFDRIVDALTKSDEFESLKKTMDKKDAAVEKWQQLVDRDFATLFQKRTGESLEVIGKQVVQIVGVLGDVQKDVTAVREGVDTLVETKTLDWLCPLESDTGTRLFNIIGERIANMDSATPGELFIQKPKYRAWVENPDRKVLWLYAPLGCGKSWLCHSIIQDLRKTCAPANPQRLLVYWFLDKNTKDMATVYQSFMRQLAAEVRDKLPEDIQVWLKQSQHTSGIKWRDELMEWFKALKRHIFIVLDGVDECFQEQSLTQPEQTRRRQQARKLISTLVEYDNPYLHIMLLSRDDFTIRNYFKTRPEAVEEMNIHDDLRQELDQFITRTMEKDADFKDRKPSVKGDISTSLKKRKERDFLWATSLLDGLRGCSKEEVRAKLQKVPSDMAKKCQESLSSVPSEDKPPMRRILMWLLRHKRVKLPLTATELATATNLSSGELENLLHNIRALVTMPLSIRSVQSARHDVDKGNDSDRDDDSDDDDSGDLLTRHVDFVHFSAKEYLEQLWNECESTASAGRGMPARHWVQGLSFSNEEAHHEITKRCLSILLAKDDVGTENPMDSPLKSYAAEYWHHHYLDVAGRPEPSIANDTADTALEHRTKTSPYVSELDDLIKQLLKSDSAAFNSWIDLYNPDEHPPLLPHKLRCEAEDQRHLDSFSNSGKDSDGISVSYMARKQRADPLYYAVKLMLLDLTIKIIKSRPTQKYVRAGSEGTVLQLALYYQHWKVAETLLDTCNASQAAITVRDGPHGSPLYIASAFGKDHIVKTLLGKGAHLDGTKDGKYGSALHAAAYHGHTATVRLLLHNGKGSVDHEEGEFGTALQAAAAQGHVEIVQLLIDNKADPLRVCGRFHTALQAALVCERHSAIETSIELRKAIDKCGFESTNRSSIGWQSAFLQLQASSPSLLHRYASLFLSTGENQHIRNEFGRPKQQILLTILEDWLLPGMNQLSRCLMLTTLYLKYQAPPQQHLEDIRGALRNIQNYSPEQELNKVDFFYKALFWSGINYILKNLEPLMRPTMESLNKAVRSAGILPMRDGESLDDRLEQKWLRMISRRAEFIDDYLDTARSKWWDTLDESSDDTPNIPKFPFHPSQQVDMELSDRIAREMAREQQLLEGKRIEALGKTSPLIQSTPLSKEPDDRDNTNDSHSTYESKNGNSDIEIHEVVDELFLLLKETVKFGKQCDRLHGTAASIEDTETIKKLTFEVFAAVARLAISLKEWNEAGVSTATKSSLAETVHLLRTVRLERITGLAAAVELNEFSSSVRKEMAPIMDSLRVQICEQVSKQMQESIRDVVQDELERQSKACEVASALPLEKQQSRWPALFRE